MIEGVTGEVTLAFVVFDSAGNTSEQGDFSFEVVASGGLVSRQGGQSDLRSIRRGGAALGRLGRINAAGGRIR